MLTSRRPGPRLEALESRTVPTVAAGAAAIIDGFDPGGPDEAGPAIQINPSDFGLVRGVTLVARTVPLTDAAHHPAVDPSDGEFGSTILELPPDLQTLLIPGDGETAIQFALVFSLAGDVDGDHRVTPEDIQTIRQSLGGRAGEDGFVAVADINQDGTISRYDLSLARDNLGIDATLLLQTLTSLIEAATGPAGDAALGLPAADASSGVSTRLLGKNIDSGADSGGGYRSNIPLADDGDGVETQVHEALGRRTTQGAISAPAGSIPVVVSSDFREGDEGWVEGHSDHNTRSDPGENLLALKAGAGGDESRTGLLLEAPGRPDRAPAFVTKKLGPEDGITPNTNYQVHMELVLDAKGPAALDAGAGHAEPRSVADAQGAVRVKIAQGDQSAGGAGASDDLVIGDPGAPAGDAGNPITRVLIRPFEARSDAEGNLWLTLGLDAGDEGTASLLLQEIVAALIPID